MPCEEEESGVYFALGLGGWVAITDNLELPLFLPVLLVEEWYSQDVSSRQQKGITCSLEFRLKDGESREKARWYKN